MIALAHSSGGISHLLTLIEHSVIYSTIRRFIWHLPLPVLIAVFALAALGIVFKGKVRGRLRSTTITETLDKEGNVVSTKKVTRK